MNPNISEFHSGVIAPVECVKEGWNLIKDRYWLFFGISIVGLLVGSAFAIVLMGPMMCGIFICFLQRKRGEQVEFGTVFKGFEYFVPGLIVQLIKAIPIVVLMVPFYLVMLAVMLSNMPLTSNLSVWYAHISLYAVTTAATLAACGAYIAIASRSTFRMSGLTKTSV